MLLLYSSWPGHDPLLLPATNTNNLSLIALARETFILKKYGIENMSKLLKSMLSLILVFMIHGSAMADKDTPEKAVMKIDSMVFDAGLVLEGSVISHEFKIRNSGNQSLKILKVQPGCGCTGVKFDNTIMPRQTGSIHVKFNTRNEIGEQVKSIKIYSNDSDNKLVTIKISADVLEAVTLEPDRIFFNGLKGRGNEKKIRVSTPTNIALNLEIEKNMMPANIDFILKKNNHGYDLLFSNKALIPGTFRGRIVLKTNLEVRPYITIPVFSRVYEKIEILPSEIDFGKISNTQETTLSRSITLKIHDNKDFKINSLGIRDKLFFAKIIQIKKSKAYKIEITPDFARLNPGKVISNLNIFTNEKSFSNINIPIAIEIN